MHRETRATAISKRVKDAVRKRDGGRCILCGRTGGPHCHVVRRSAGGMGVEENIVTLCDDCHRAYDEGVNMSRFGAGTTRESIRCFLESYLKQFYPGWTAESVIYKKQEETRC